MRRLPRKISRSAYSHEYNENYAFYLRTLQKNDFAFQFLN